MSGTTWTTEQDQAIRDNRGTLSAGQMADLINHKFGLNRTRSSVLGRVNRLELGRCLHAIGSGVRHRPRRHKQPAKVMRLSPPLMVFDSPPIPVEPLNVQFGDLKAHHCREIVGAGDYGLSLSCGHERLHLARSSKPSLSSWCRWHHAINHK